MRHALSSNHYSTDLQLSDVVSKLSTEEREQFDAVFPDWDDLIWKWGGSWVDTEISGVDADYTSGAIDWIEANFPDIWWEDGEPWRTDEHWVDG